MDRPVFLRMLVVLSLTAVFIKIYQCNRFVKKIYEKQRLEKLTVLLSKKIDGLRKEIDQLSYYQGVSHWAMHERGMQPGCFEQQTIMVEDVCHDA